MTSRVHIGIRPLPAKINCVAAEVGGGGGENADRNAKFSPPTQANRAAAGTAALDKHIGVTKT